MKKENQIVGNEVSVKEKNQSYQTPSYYKAYIPKQQSEILHNT